MDFLTLILRRGITSGPEEVCAAACIERLTDVPMRPAGLDDLCAHVAGVVGDRARDLLQAHEGGVVPLAPLFDLSTL